MINYINGMCSFLQKIKISKRYRYLIFFIILGIVGCISSNYILKIKSYEAFFAFFGYIGIVSLIVIFYKRFPTLLLKWKLSISILTLIFTSVFFLSVEYIIFINDVSAFQSIEMQAYNGDDEALYNIMNQRKIDQTFNYHIEEIENKIALCDSILEHLYSMSSYAILQMKTDVYQVNIENKYIVQYIIQRDLSQINIHESFNNILIYAYKYEKRDELPSVFEGFNSLKYEDRDNCLVDVIEGKSLMTLLSIEKVDSLGSQVIRSTIADVSWSAKLKLFKYQSEKAYLLAVMQNPFKKFITVNFIGKEFDINSINVKLIIFIHILFSAIIIGYISRTLYKILDGEA